MNESQNETTALHEDGSPNLWAQMTQRRALAARLIDSMLAAQSRFASAWRDGAPLTPQQERDERQRDEDRAKLLELVT